LFFKGILGGRKLRNISVVMGLKIEDGIAISSTHTSSVINSSNVDIRKAKKEIEKAIIKINPFHFEFVGALHTNGIGFTRYTKIKGESK